MNTIILFLLLLIAPLVIKGENKTSNSDAKTIALNDYLPQDSAVVYGKIDNGLTYYIRKNVKPENRAELQIIVNVGSILENESQQGLAHFVEHMAFNGTKHFEKQELVKYLESIGMRFGPDINAYTSFDETVYMLQVPTDSLEIMEKAFIILSDWAHLISFTDEEIEKERGVVIEEWRLGQGASSRMRDKQLPILLHNSRYAQRLPIGKKAVLDTFSHQLPRRFYKDWYRPDLMAVVAVGDFNSTFIKEMIKKYFNQIPQTEDPRERKIYPVPDHEETLYSIASDSEATYSKVNIYYKFPLEENRTAAAYREHLIERLYNRMVNERLSDLTRKENPPFIYPVSREGRLVRSKNYYILGAVVEENGIQRGMDALLSEATRVKTYGFTKTELERHKIAILRFRERQYNERDKTESSRYVSQCIAHFLNEDPMPDVGFKYELDKRFLPDISLEEVNQLADKWIKDQNRVIIVESPEKEGVFIPTEDQLTAILDSVQIKQISPYVDDILDKPLISRYPRQRPVISESYQGDLDVTEWKLENGVRVILKPTDFKNDEIHLSAFSPGGISLVEDSNLIAAETAVSILRESGLGDFNRTQLSKHLSGKIAYVSPYMGELSEGFSGSASPKDLEILLQLIHLYFTAPREDSTAYIALKERFVGIYQNRSASPEAAYYDTLNSTLTQRHPRFRPWSVQTLEKMDLQKSLQIFKERFADAGDFTFFFVGNIEPDSIKPLIELYLGGLPVLNRQETWKNVTYRYPRGIIEKEVYKGKEPKSQTSIDFTGPFEWNRENRYICNSMLHILRIKLRERLREDLSGTYSINAYGSYMHFPFTRYRITFQFGSDPERVKELTTEIFTQIDSLKNFGTTTEYLQKVQEIQLREYETNLKRNSFWLSNLEYKYYHGESVEDILTYKDLVNHLTLEKIQQAAKKYINTNNYVRVVLYPELEKSAMKE